MRYLVGDHGRDPAVPSARVHGDAVVTLHGPPLPPTDDGALQCRAEHLGSGLQVDCLQCGLHVLTVHVYYERTGLRADTVRTGTI